MSKMGQQYIRECEALATYNADEVRHLRVVVEKFVEELRTFGRVKAENALLRTRLKRIGRNRPSEACRRWWACESHAYGDEDCPPDAA